MSPGPWRTEKTLGDGSIIVDKDGNVVVGHGSVDGEPYDAPIIDPDNWDVIVKAPETLRERDEKIERINSLGKLLEDEIRRSVAAEARAAALEKSSVIFEKNSEGATALWEALQKIKTLAFQGQEQSLIYHQFYEIALCAIEKFNCAAETKATGDYPKIRYEWMVAGDGIDLIRTWPNGKCDRNDYDNCGHVNANATGSTLSLMMLYNAADGLLHACQNELENVEDDLKTQGISVCTELALKMRSENLRAAISKAEELKPKPAPKPKAEPIEQPVHPLEVCRWIVWFFKTREWKHIEKLPMMGSATYGDWGDPVEISRMAEAAIKHAGGISPAFTQAELVVIGTVIREFIENHTLDGLIGEVARRAAEQLSAAKSVRAKLGEVAHAPSA